MPASPLRRKGVVVPAQDRGRGDVRLARVAEEDSERDVLEGRVRAVLREAGWETADDAVRDVAGELGGVLRGADVVRERLLDVGRRLVRVHERLGRGGYRALIRAGLVPFDEAAASKLRTIAERVDAGLLPEASLPRTSKVAYAAVSMPPEVVRRLVNEGRLGPDTSYRQLRAMAQAEVPPPAATKVSARERKILLGRIANYERKLKELRARLGLEGGRF